MHPGRTWYGPEALPEPKVASARNARSLPHQLDHHASKSVVTPWRIVPRTVSRTGLPMIERTR